MYEALNKGLRAATGDIIGLLHSDDFFYDNSVVSCIASTFKEKKPDILYGNGIFVNCNNTNKVVRNWISGKYTKSKVSRGWLPLHPTVYITKSWLKECGHYNENYKIAADSDWLIRSLYKMTPNVIYLDKYIVKMRMGGLSTKPSLVKKKWSEDMALYKQHGLKPYITLTKKILSKIPQFV